MVFRKESKVDAFQRQISALRQQLGGADETEGDEQPDERDTPRFEAAPAVIEDPRTTGYDEAPSATASGILSREESGYGFGSFAAASTARPFEAPAVPAGVDLAAEPPAVPAMPVDPDASVIANDATWKGDFQSSGSLHVHGRVEGTLRAKDRIFVAEEAVVDATIVAASVVIAGRVQGSIRCDERFEVLPPGRVGGEVQSPTLVIHEGAVMNAQVRMGASESTEQAPTPVVHRRSAGSRG